MSASSTLRKPCMILGVFYFLFQRVSLAKYILVLRVYSLLLQMTCYIRASARIASTWRVTRTRSLGCDHLLVYFPECFCEMLICKTGNRTWTKCVCLCLCFCYFITWFVIIVTPWCCKLISELLVKCNVWCIYIEWCNLGCKASWFEIFCGFDWLPGLYGLKFENLSVSGACFCTCALIIWTVLLQSWSRWLLREMWSSNV
jgi:hypothetical protein